MKEVAALLEIGEKTSYTMAPQGTHPTFEIGAQWRFRRADLDAWIDVQHARRVHATEDR